MIAIGVIPRIEWICTVLSNDAVAKNSSFSHSTSTHPSARRVSIVRRSSAKEKPHLYAPYTPSTTPHPPPPKDTPSDPNSPSTYVLRSARTTPYTPDPIHTHNQHHTPLVPTPLSSPNRTHSMLRTLPNLLHPNSTNPPIRPPTLNQPKHPHPRIVTSGRQ